MVMGVDERLPEGCECGLAFFVTSDETGLEVKARIDGLPIFPAFTAEPDAVKLLKALSVDVAPLEGLASDWRFMTRAEIADYKRRERRDEDPDPDDDGLDDDFQGRGDW